MTTTISTHRAAMATAISNVSGLRVFDYGPAQPPFPIAMVGFPTQYDPHATLDGARDLVIPVSLYVGYGANRAAEDELESFIDPVIDAIETVAAYQVQVVRDFQVLEVNENPVALWCIIQVLVLA